MKKIRLNLTLFLILSSGCVTAPPPATSFDGRWEFVEIPGNPVKACLKESDIYELRELLIRCERSK